MNILSMLNKQRIEDTRIEKKIVVSTKLIDLENFILSHPAAFYKKYPDRKIFNYYFDTENLSFFFQHMSGFPERKKFRIRWYEKFTNYEEGEFQFEIKRKQHLIADKYVLHSNKKPDSGFLNLKNLHQIMTAVGCEGSSHEYFRQYFGCLFNSYNRSYFYSADGRVRINLDKDICYSEEMVCSSFLQTENSAVVEFKYPAVNTEVGEKIIKSFGHPQVAHSKYVKGIQLLYAE